MNTKNEILNFLKSNQSYIRSHFHITKIGLFGSFSKDEQREDSDVDILIELDKSVQNIYDTKHSLALYLSQAFERKVDIAREKYLKPYAKKSILKDTIYVY